jgi:4-hydroxythreonine-4-phosphate dehydrogenase
MRPRIALTVGDPAGIGPETVLAALARSDVRARASYVVVGPAALRPPTMPMYAPGAPRHDVEWSVTDGPERWAIGEVQASCGAAAVAALRRAHELALAGEVDALVTAPVNKAALHAAGTRVEGQTELLAEWCGATRYEMIGIAGALRVMLLTRHMPLADALVAVRSACAVGGQLEAHLALFDEALRGLLGIDAPRIAVAGLNPHAGEGGILGRDELDLIAPAVARARASGLDVSGPISPDAVFHDALQGRYDGVLALYHDQAFIPLKLLAAGRGITVIAGLPYLRLSPMHGTAFDIAGRGLADPTNLIEALLRAAELVERRQDAG